jgi:predicted secreted Zn-dependent protease
MRRSTAATAVLILALAVGACSPATPSPSGSATPSPSPAASPTAVAALDPCVTAVVHLTAFANRLGSQLAALRPLVTDPTFDSGATAAGIRGVSSTLVAYEGLEARVTPCSATAPIAAQVAAIREGAKSSIDASTAASITDRVTQRAAAAELFGLLDSVLDVAAATDRAAIVAGVDTQVAVIPDESSRPLGSLPPLPTPTPRPPVLPPPDVTAYDAAFFGPDSTVKTYRVSGDSPLQIVASIRASGPPVDWIGRAEALTLATPHIRIAFSGSGSSCRVVAKASPPISFSFTITLPRWVPPSGVSGTTVTWWNAELRRAAVHEHHHVDLWRAAGTAMSKAVSTSTCSTFQSRIASIVKATARENCQFDMDEYGEALGLSMDACLAP